MNNIEVINILQQLREDLKDEITLLKNDIEQLKKDYSLNLDLIDNKEDLFNIKIEQYKAIYETIKRFKLLSIK
jgi:hypothetical protein